MSIRPATRNYDTSALELWLERFAAGWEHLFGQEDLAAAREIYRQNQSREISVFENETSVFWTLENGTAHAILTWDDGRISWRTTFENPERANALAAASIYEIEEFLGDELNDTAPLENKNKPPKKNGKKTPPAGKQGKIEPPPAKIPPASKPFLRALMLFFLRGERCHFFPRFLGEQTAKGK